jgi:hypothetical protein
MGSRASLIGIAMLYFIDQAIIQQQKKASATNKKTYKGIAREQKQEEQNLPAAPEYQVPGQQYQPLMPEYDKSFGAYIQDLPLGE